MMSARCLTFVYLKTSEVQAYTQDLTDGQLQ